MLMSSSQFADEPLFKTDLLQRTTYRHEMVNKTKISFIRNEAVN